MDGGKFTVVFVVAMVVVTFERSDPIHRRLSPDVKVLCDQGLNRPWFRPSCNTSECQMLSRLSHNQEPCLDLPLMYGIYCAVRLLESPHGAAKSCIIRVSSGFGACYYTSNWESVAVAIAFQTRSSRCLKRSNVPPSSFPSN